MTPSPRVKREGTTRGNETHQYYNYQWDPVTDRAQAAFVIRTVRDREGRVVEHHHESFKGIPTRSTDPKTGSHSH